MRSFTSTTLPLLLLPLFAACSGGDDSTGYEGESSAPSAEGSAEGSTSEAEGSTSEAETSSPLALQNSTQRVECGCALEEVGHCGNYVEIEGQYVPITGDVDLGPMEWCGVTGLEAEVTGTLREGEFVAESLRMVP